MTTPPVPVSYSPYIYESVVDTVSYSLVVNGIKKKSFEAKEIGAFAVGSVVYNYFLRKSIRDLASTSAIVAVPATGTTPAVAAAPAAQAKYRQALDLLGETLLLGTLVHMVRPAKEGKTKGLGTWVNSFLQVAGAKLISDGVIAIMAPSMTAPVGVDNLR